MTRAQEAPVGILEIFDQNYKKTPKEWDVFKIFDQNGKKIPKEWDVLKKIDQNWWDIYTDHFYFIIELRTFHTGMFAHFAITICTITVDYCGKVTKRLLSVL